MMFSKETRRVLVLGALAFLLGGYTYITTPEKKILKAQGVQVSDRPIFTFHPDKITQFTVVSRGKQITGERTSEGWRSPDGTSLPSVAVDDFLMNLTKIVHLGEVEKGKDGQLADYGLQPPESQISLTVSGEGVSKLALGAHNPVNTSLYALVGESSQVILVGSIISWELRKLFDAVQATANAGV